MRLLTDVAPTIFCELVDGSPDPNAATNVLNRASGSHPASQPSDWTASWKKNAVSDDEWRALRDELGREMHAWIAALREPREVSDVEAGWILGCLAHVAYHFGAIRQIDRAACGPTAEDEARAEAAMRSRS